MRLQDACRIEVCGPRVVVSGDLDLLRAEELRKAIAAVTADEADLDLSGVVFVGWAGLKVLLDARLDHPLLRIIAANPRVLAVLEASGTVEYLTSGRGVVDHPSRWRDSRGDV